MKSPLDLIPNGYGTYISLGILFGAEVAKAFGWIDESTYQHILVVAGGGTAAFLRRAISVSDAKTATGQAAIADQVGMAPSKIEAQIKPPPQAPTA